MTMVSLPNILFSVEDEMIFFFDENASTLFEEDIFTEDNSKVAETPVFNKTVLYSGGQPAQTPKTGPIQAPSDVALIIPPFIINNTGLNGDADVTILASNTLDTDDGVTLLSVGTVFRNTSVETARTVVLPANKFLTIKATVVVAGSIIDAEGIKTIERGSLTRDIDPLLQ